VIQGAVNYWKYIALVLQLPTTTSTRPARAAENKQRNKLQMPHVLITEMPAELCGSFVVS
jgi:hypothetical protein